MSSLHELYQAHLAVLQQRARQVLTLCSLDGLLIHSGELQTVFFDDQTYPFKVNPQFKAWLPLTQTPGCWLWIDGATRPKLFFNSPSDYWHKVDPLPETYWSDEVDIVALKEGNDLGRLLPLAGKAAAYLGPVTERAKQPGIGTHRVNPKAVIDYLDFYRSFKTDYELCCMREAQKIAVKGHLAARQAFFEGNSELSIHHRYLSVTGQRESTTPYGNIVAINDHAAVLHYTQLESQQPEEARSFLLDAGAEYQGYAADVTRTYARQPGTLFADLVAAINQHQQDLVRTLKVGARYTDYHVQMNQRIAGLLCDTGLLQGISQEALVAENITSAFMPHGIGHQLGLQVHDVAGFMQDDQGSYLSAPEDYPWLRCTRILEPRMVLTIEPGLYFIESLLRPWRNSARSRHFNWQAIDALQPYGGIRIEDNVVIWADRTENMTRDLHLA